MEFMTVEEVARILKTSPEFVYKNRIIFGGVKIGRLVRFPKDVFEKIMKEVISSGGETRSDVEILLHEKEGALQERRLSHQGRSKRSGGKSENRSEEDKYGLYRLVRESVKGSGDQED